MWTDARPITDLRNDRPRLDPNNSGMNKIEEENKIFFHDGLRLRKPNEFNIVFADPRSDSSEGERVATGMDKLAACVAEILRADLEMFSEMQSETDRHGKPTQLDAAFEVEPIFIRVQPNSEAREIDEAYLANNSNNELEQVDDSQNEQDEADQEKETDLNFAFEAPIPIELEQSVEQTGIPESKNQTYRISHRAKQTEFGGPFDLEPNFVPFVPSFDTSDFLQSDKQPDWIPARNYDDQTLLRGCQAEKAVTRDIVEGAMEQTPMIHPDADIYESNESRYLLTVTLPTLIGIIVTVLLCCFCIRPDGCLCHCFDEREPEVFVEYTVADDLDNHRAYMKKSFVA